MELLTIISKSIQLLSSFILIAALFSFVAIKMKSKKRKINYSQISEPKGRAQMQNQNLYGKKKISEVVGEQKCLLKNENDNPEQKNKFKIYAVYNAQSKPNFYLQNRLSWYKNFD